jgi:hypothetical protein
MVGRAATMRLSLVMTPSFKGTLKIAADQNVFCLYLNIFNCLFAKSAHMRNSPLSCGFLIVFRSCAGNMRVFSYIVFSRFFASISADI